jgi:hypothetical protein
LAKAIMNLTKKYILSGLSVALPGMSTKDMCKDLTL